MNTTNSEIVATRRTFDGVTINLHADGSLSERLNFIKGGKLPVASMWRVIADLAIYTHEELPELIRSVKAGTWKPFAIRREVPEQERVYRSIVTASGMKVDLRIR